MRRSDRSRHGRRPRRDLWRGSRELCGCPPRRDARHGSAVAALRRRAARFQGAEADRADERAAEDRARQARPQGAGGEVAARSNGRLSLSPCGRGCPNEVRAREGYKRSSPLTRLVALATRHPLPRGERVIYRPLRANECTQPCMRFLALAISSLEKKSSAPPL